MNAYIHTMTATDENGEKSILYPTTKQEAVEGLEERLAKLEVADITETEDTTLENSNAGRLLFTEIDGDMEQGANPSPTNPQEIRNSVVSGIKTHKKNMLDFTVTRKSLLYLLPIKEGQSFTVSYNYADTSVDSRCALYIFDEIGSYATADLEGEHQLQKTSTKYAEATGRTFITITSEHNGYLYFRQVTPANYENFSNFQVEEGTEATEYEPYTESTITFSEPISLYGLDDARDILTSKQICRKFVKTVFEGSESWASTSTVGRYYINSLGCKGYGYVMCSQANRAVGSTEVLNTCYLRDTSNGRFIMNTEFATLDEWKAHLASNPMTVVYEMAEETTEELPIADQIALNSLLTYAGITHVEFISEIKPTFSAKYGTTEMGGMTLESLLTARSNDLRLSAVESAVINNI